MNTIAITSRLGRIPGLFDGKVAYFDFWDSESQQDVRHFVLVEESVKLMYEPWGWKNRWYADLIKVFKPFLSDICTISGISLQLLLCRILNKIGSLKTRCGGCMSGFRLFFSGKTTT